MDTVPRPDGDALDVRSVLAHTQSTSVPPLSSLGGEAVTPKEPLIVPRDMSFTLNYDTPEGERLKATLTSKVPTFDTKVRMGRVEVDLCAGRPMEMFAPDRQRWMRMVARVSQQLVKPPEWVLEWAVQDSDLLQRVYDFCMAHEVLFFRPDAAEGGPAESAERVAIHSALDQRVEALRHLS